MECNCDDEDDWDDERDFVGWMFDYVVIPLGTIISICAALAAASLCVLIFVWCLDHIARILVHYV